MGSGEANDGRLEVDALSIRAGDRALLDNVTFTLDRGRIAALVAPSGFGKTTLLRSVAGLHPVTRGSVRLGGRTLREMGPPAFRRRVVYVAQRPALLDATVEDNLRRPFAYRSADRSYPEREAKSLLEHLQIVAAYDQDAKQLSAGEQQRVALVRALLLEPRVLLLDEPTSALDEANIKRVEALLRETVEPGRLGILLVTHEASQIERFADEQIDLEPFGVSA